MGNVMIRAENVGKLYHIGTQRLPYTRLSESIMKFVTAPIRGFYRQPQPRPSTTPFWALRHVSFEVQQGEVIGIIGGNGVGKSTLLKVLSRITFLSEGRVEIFGRVGALLEVGTGFHPELTGRENVYLSGTILGMKRAEIDRKFDEMLAFAEVEQFIDTPVKHYSSGMEARLAFSVAAHLESDILIVDEVLAVGDQRFQKKCLAKMNDEASSGRTVLFVSHNMAVIKSLCTRTLLLEKGGIKADGPTDQIIGKYLETISESSPADGVIADGVARVGGTEAMLRRVSLTNLSGEPIKTVYFGQRLHVSVLYEVKRAIDHAAVEIGISTLDGVRIGAVCSLDNDRPAASLG